METITNNLINSYQINRLSESFRSSVNSKKLYNNKNIKPFVLSSANNQKTHQMITLGMNQQYNLGTINGKPFNIKLLQEAGFEWSGRIKMSGRPEGRVTPEQIVAARAFDSYTPNEWMQCEHIGSVIAEITRITEKNLKTDSFNELVEYANISQNEINSALQRLNLDPSMPFSINGRTFIINCGILEDYNGGGIISY